MTTSSPEKMTSLRTRLYVLTTNVGTKQKSNKWPACKTSGKHREITRLSLNYPSSTKQAAANPPLPSKPDDHLSPAQNLLLPHIPSNAPQTGELGWRTGERAANRTCCVARRSTQGGSRESRNKGKDRTQSLCALDTKQPSEIGLLSCALLESQLPRPEQLTFDGDPKRYQAFWTSFDTNIAAKVTDLGTKLMYLLQHCTGEAKDLIKDCALLRSETGFATAVSRLEKRFGQSHLIVRSYIDGVTS